MSIAYQVFGDGPIDLLMAPGFVSHCEVLWENPDVARMFEGLGSFARVILFDKREQGLSDRLGRPPTIEEMVDDMQAVLDAADSERAAVLGISEGGAMALLFAASHPARCTHLVHLEPPTRGSRERRTIQTDSRRRASTAGSRWWTRDGVDPWALELFAPSRKGDPRTEQWWAQLLRSGTSPRGAKELMDLYREADVRSALPLVSAPTLVMHRADDRPIRPALGRYIADRIPQADFVEVPGADHLMWTERGEEVLDLIEQFLTGTAGRAPPSVSSPP